MTLILSASWGRSVGNRCDARAGVGTSSPRAGGALLALAAAQVDRGPQELAYDFWWHLGFDTVIT